MAAAITYNTAPFVSALSTCSILNSLDLLKSCCIRERFSTLPRYFPPDLQGNENCKVGAGARQWIYRMVLRCFFFFSSPLSCVILPVPFFFLSAPGVLDSQGTLFCWGFVHSPSPPPHPFHVHCPGQVLSFQHMARYCQVGIHNSTDTMQERLLKGRHYTSRSCCTYHKPCAFSTCLPSTILVHTRRTATKSQRKSRLLPH